MIRTIAGSGKQGFSGDGGEATNAQLSAPSGIAISESGEIYIADQGNRRIRKVALNGFISTIAGNGFGGLSGDGGLAIHAEFDCPSGFAVSSNSDVYIAEACSCKIRKVAPNGIISTIAGNGVKGFGGDGGLAIHAQLSTPAGIAVGLSGELYIADQHNHRIRKVAPNGLISTIAGNGTQGFSGDGGLAIHAQLSLPQGIVVSPNGEIYIADTFNHRIRKVTPNGLISTVAGNGQYGFSGDGGLAIDAQLYSPCYIAISSSGELYIADRNNNRIRKVTSDGSISTIAGNGKPGFSGDGGEAIHAQLNWPHGIAVDLSGDLYIADSQNHRIRKVDGLYFNGLIIRTRLKKYERDHTSNGFVCFLPLLAKLAPSFYKTILSTGTLLNANEKQIVQQLVDSLMYGTELGLDDLESATMVDWLFVLGMIEGSEFFGVNTKLLTEFMDALTVDSIPVVLEKLHNLKERSITENGLLSQMVDYTLGRATLMLKVSPALSTNPVIQKHLVQIVSKMYQSELAPILLSETKRENTEGIESLFNDSSTSDIKILLGESEWHCHRTILSSYSSYFETLFGSGDSFNDLEGGTYRVDCTEFGEELHEVIIKYCYNLFDESSISESVAIPLFKCASFYGMTQLADYCVHGIRLSTGNYFELIEQLGEYPCEALCAKLVEFVFLNAGSLGVDEEKLRSLPEQIKEKLLWKCMQERVRK